MKRPRPFVAALALCAALAGCGEKSPDKPDAIILHTGRLVGNVYPMGAGAAAPLQHYPYLAGYVKQVRAEAAAIGAPVFLFDLGDSLDGSFAGYATKGRNMVEYFNGLEYDAICLGNLDGNVRPEVIAQLRPTVLCPFTSESGEPALPGTQVAGTFTRGGVSITLASNFYGDTRPEEQPLRFPASFGAVKDRVVPVRDYSAVAGTGLRVMSWMKFEVGAADGGGFLERLHQLDFDLVLAHRVYEKDSKSAWAAPSHLETEPPASVNILRHNSGFTVARVDLRRDGKKWRVLRQSLQPMTSNTAPADTAIVQRIAQLSDAVQKADATITKLDHAWDEEEIFRLYLSALTHEPGAGAVAYSPSSIRSGWSQGTLRASQVFNSVPWKNDLVAVEMPASKLAALAALPGVRILRREGAPDPVRLVTSRFFATLFREQSGLDGLEIRSLGDRLEFEFFSDFLKSQTSLEEAKSHGGWVDETP